MMENALKERVLELEKRLGIAQAKEIKNVNEELIAVRRKLTQAGAGFLLKIPIDILRKLNDLALRDDYLTQAEKRNCIEFNYALMMKRAELLEQFEKDKEIVFKSESIANFGEHLPALDAAEREINETASDVRIFPLT
ncbi:unnamed protein product [Gongylonema pulchrum]|uniref:Site-specific recombinase n=1 Tax=Gongylonema pulchrum TaxID=637853 RepID=A0A183E4L7_9BILA|nr:unnamed protein product [Gongylonema pulchrum]